MESPLTRAPSIALVWTWKYHRKMSPPSALSPEANASSFIDAVRITASSRSTNAERQRAFDVVNEWRSADDRARAIALAIAMTVDENESHECAFVAASFASRCARELASDRSTTSSELESYARAFASNARIEARELAAKTLGDCLSHCSASVGSSALLVALSVALTCARDGDVERASTRVGVETCARVAEAADDARGLARHELIETCVRARGEVLGVLGEILNAMGAGRSSARASLRASCARAARAWCAMDAGGGTRVSPTQFIREHGGIFGDIMSCLAIESSGCGAAAVDMLVELHRGRSGTESEEFQAMNAVTRGLLAHGAEASAPSGQALARNIALVAVALSERCVNVLVRGDADSLALVSLVLALMERHGREVTEVAIDFFLMINTVSTSSRHESMRAPMHARLVEVLLKQSMLPHGFTCWNDAEEDEETFERFREYVVADLLENCYGVLRGQYLNIIGSTLSSAQNWRVAESGAFALRAAAASVKEDLEASTSAPAAAAAADSFLMQVLSSVAENHGDNTGLFSSHALVRAETCEMIAAYAFWLGRKSGGDTEAQAALTRGVLMYITASFPHDSAWSNAAAAFKNVCARCAWLLRDPLTFAALLEHTERCVARVHTNFDDRNETDHRTSVMEGLARVVAAMPIEQASQASARLIAPVIARCKSFVLETASTTSGNQVACAEASRAMAAELSLIAAAVRFLEFAPNVSVEHPAISVLSAAWLTLEEIAGTRAWRSTCVAKALSYIYIAALLSAKSKAVDMIVPVLESIARSFTATREASLLEPVSTAIEVSTTSAEGGSSEIFPDAPHVAHALGTIFAQIVRETAACAIADPSSAETWERADALFTLTRTFIIFAPARGLANEELFTALDLAVQALELREYAPVRSALALLNALVAPGEKAQMTLGWLSNASRVDEFLATRGARIVQTILIAGCSGTTPRVAIRAACAFIAAMLERAPDEVETWLLDASFRASADDLRSRHALARVLASRPRLSAVRLTSALCDYVLIALRERDVDDLGSYVA